MHGDDVALIAGGTVLLLLVAAIARAALPHISHGGRCSSAILKRIHDQYASSVNAPGK